MANLILQFGFLLLSLLICFCESRSIPSSKPQLDSFNQSIARGCSYSVSIKTSCSSTYYTRDKVSLAFGDEHGNEVYAPRLDDPRSKIFERCSSDTFEIAGPCTYEICYLNLLRIGSDGWKPETVKVVGADRRQISFSFNKFLPNGVWFGFNHCRNGGSTSNSNV